MKISHKSVISRQISKQIKDNTYFVIAAYNESKQISKVIFKLHKNGYYNLIVVDDGSKDDTILKAVTSGATVLEHKINRGQGAALQTGIDYALQQGAKYIVTFDADGQHRVEDLAKMLNPVINEKVEVTLGSRFLKRSNLPLKRRITLKIGVLIILLFYGVKMTDAHNGYRVLSKKAAEKINITSDRMEHASQIVEEINKKKIKYTEIPVKIIYTDETLAKGHGSFFQGINVFLRMIIRKLFS